MEKLGNKQLAGCGGKREPRLGSGKCAVYFQSQREERLAKAQVE